jgi:hypothetical protein
MTRFFIAVFFGVLFAVQQGAPRPVEERDQAATPAEQDSTKASAPAPPGGAITGLVLDDGGQPIADAQIIIDNIGVRNQMQFLNTDVAGRFKTPWLTPGLYAMEVHWPGYVINPEGLHPSIHRAGEYLTFNMIKGGVITGRVIDATGDPVVAETVIAQRVRDLDGHRVYERPEGQRTDDRGVYRIYGLEPGRYVIYANTSSVVYVSGNEVGEETPTYYPSSTRDTAVEIPLQAGEEVGGIDIQRRAERGHAISGIVTGDFGPNNSAEGVSVKLINASNGEIVNTAGLYKAPRYAMYGVPDGEYELYAQKLYGQGGNAGSALRRVVLRGVDLTGMDLELIKYGSITGRALVNSANADPPAPRCEGQARSHLEEIILDARIDSPPQRRQDHFFVADEYWGSWRGSVVDPKGTFKIQNLESGLYHLNINLPGEDWYVCSTTRPAASSANKREDIARAGIPIKSGEQITGVEVLLAKGAASLRGHAVLAPEPPPKNTARPSPRLQVHLLPAEEAAAGDLLRYDEALADKNGAFEFKHLAPGKYWLLAKPAPEAESLETPRRPVAWGEAVRAKLRRDAKASNNEIELKPCERLDDYVLKVNLR